MEDTGCCGCRPITKASALTLTSCIVMKLLSSACLGVAVTLEPFSEQPTAAILSGVQLLAALLGAVGSCLVLCQGGSDAASALLRVAALTLLVTAVGLAVALFHACVLVVPADPKDWHAFSDADGTMWSYADSCSGTLRTHGEFHGLPLFMVAALHASWTALGCIWLAARARRAPPGAPTGGGATGAHGAGSATSVAALALVLATATALWGSSCMGLLGSEQMQLAAAPAPPPRPPMFPADWRPPPSPAPPPRFVPRHGRQHKPAHPPPPAPPPRPPVWPPAPVWPEGSSLFSKATGPCKVVGACVTSSKYVACVDPNYCSGPSCVGPPCAETRSDTDRRFYSYDEPEYRSYDVMVDYVDDGPMMNAPYMDMPTMSAPAMAMGGGGSTSYEDDSGGGGGAVGRRLQPGGRSGYDDGEHCEVEFVQPTRLEVVHFDTESCCDSLRVTWAEAPPRLGGDGRPGVGGLMWQKGVPEMVVSAKHGGGRAPPYVSSYAGRKGPQGVEATGLSWHSDGGVTASGWAVCAAGHAADLTPGWAGSGFTEPGPAFPWHELQSSWGFAAAALASALLALLAALLALGQPLHAPATGGCFRGRRRAAAARALAALAGVGKVMACAGLVRTCTVACEESAHHCAPLLPFFWGGALLCALGAPALFRLALALAPPAAEVSQRTEACVARLLLVTSLLTIGLASVCVTVTVTARAFQRLPAVYIFSILALVAPGFGVGGAAMILRAAARPRASGATQRREHATRMKLASALLVLHVFLVGVAFIGLPVSAAAGYGAGMAAFVVAAVACGVCAAVGLALLVLVMQASSGLSSEEMAEMVSANNDALAASQQHVMELEHNMSVMIEQQTQLLAALGRSITLPPAAEAAAPAAEEAAGAEAPAGA